MMLDLSTPLSRVDYVSHIYENHVGSGLAYVRQFCWNRCIGEHEIEDGIVLGEARRAAYHALRSRNGDPAYGGGGEWNHNAAFDKYILERAADPGVSYMRPAPGVREMWLKAAQVLRDYSEHECKAYFLDDREVSVTDLMRDYPANEQLQAAITLLKPGEIAFIFSDDGVYELRAEVAPQACGRAA